MEYLGQEIELVQQDTGWIAMWWHNVGLIQVGLFPTASAAWSAIAELIQRDLAMRSILGVLDEWMIEQRIDEFEYAFAVDGLAKFVLSEQGWEEE